MEDLRFLAVFVTARAATTFDRDFRQIYHPRAMGQPADVRFATASLRFATAGWQPPILLALLLAFAIGCDQSPSTVHLPATTRANTVASLSPAATEILIGMGAADRLVAVSNFDPPRAGTMGLPRVGDYQTTDWERLASLRPAVMITQFAADRLPAGLVQKSRDLGIELVNLPITRLDDIYVAMRTLGKSIGDANRGDQSAGALKAKLDAIAARSTGRKVSAIIVIDEKSRGVVGHDNYLNDILEIAGGANVIPPSTSPYPSIDAEMLAKLDPEVIFQLLGDSAPQVIEQAMALWQTMPNLRAVKNHRVHVFADPLLVQPSQRVGELAQSFANALIEARNGSSSAGGKP